MKNLLKFSAFAILFGMATFLTSCDEDDDYCYECELAGQSLTLCEGDDGPNGIPYTRAELDAYALGIETSNAGTCTKQ